MSIGFRIGFIIVSLLYVIYLNAGVGMSTSLEIVSEPLPYESKLQSRQFNEIDTIVIHCTELPTMALAREFGERVHYDSGTGNSGHYYIDRDGTVTRYVRDDKVANHTRGYNPQSIGIELINVGRYPNWYHKDSQMLSEGYTEAQMDALVALLKHLTDTIPTIKNIAGHEDLDTATMPAEDDPNVTIQRKIDPGPLFDWQRIESQFDLNRLR